MSEIILQSEVGIDYAPLRKLLAGGKWKEADETTYHLILKASNREKKGYLLSDDWLNIPSKDLCTIDQLWVKYSYSYFGFSVQKQIWESLGGHPDVGGEVYGKFIDILGWSKRGELLDYNDLTFNTSSPPGHLPTGGFLFLVSLVCGGCSFWSLYSHKDL